MLKLLELSGLADRVPQVLGIVQHEGDVNDPVSGGRGRAGRRQRQHTGLPALARLSLSLPGAAGCAGGRRSALAQLPVPAAHAALRAARCRSPTSRATAARPCSPCLATSCLATDSDRWPA